MTVWVVTVYDVFHDGTQVAGVFSSEDAAVRSANGVQGRRFETMVEGWEVES